MGDAESDRVAEIERKLRRLEEDTARQSAALRVELQEVQRIRELEAKLHELEARHAAETVELRRELDRARGGHAPRELPPLRRDDAAGPAAPLAASSASSPHPPLVPFLLWYQLPTLIVAVCLLPVPLFVVLLAAPLLVAMLIGSLVSYGLERRRVRLALAGTPSPSVWLHQLAPLIVLQPAILLLSYVSATFSLSGGNSFRVDDFAMTLALLEAGYLFLVVPTIALGGGAARRVGRR